MPSNISKNTLSVYQSPRSLINSTNKTLCVNKECIPKRLTELCIICLADNWKEHPIVNEMPLLSDICALLDMLPTDLPLNITVVKIEYNMYWLRCYRDRWPKQPPPGRNFSEVEVLFEKKKVAAIDWIGDESKDNFDVAKEKSWKQHYLEMHLQETLECLVPENYDPEKIEILSSMCESYVSTLTLNEMQAPLTPDVPDHIPLNLVLSFLRGLTELSICFKQTYVGEKFSWHIFNTTMADITNLAKGLEHITSLKMLRIRNSDINCSKVKILLKSLLKNGSLRILDFSHCKISDNGTLILCKFVKDQGKLEHLILCNNYIGPSGAQGLAYILSENCSLISLDLRLNSVNSKGTKFLNTSLCTRRNQLRTLLLAGCGLTSENTNLDKMVYVNQILENLDLSNNRMGEGIGKILLEALNYNKTLKKLDVRRCNFSSKTETEILQKVQENRKPSKHVSTFSKLEVDMENLFPTSFVSEFNAMLI